MKYVLCFKSLSFVFRVGPLHSDTKYSVGAEKEGYILTASTTHQGSFKAFKLGEIIVKVRYSRGLPNKVLLYFGNRWTSVVTFNTVLSMFDEWLDVRVTLATIDSVNAVGVCGLHRAQLYS